MNFRKAATLYFNMSEIISILDGNSAAQISGSSALGERGEKIAAEYLLKQGYRLILSNFKVPVGRNSKGVSVTGEIDIIALDGETLCFIEVKTRRSDDFIPIVASVTLRKQRQITRTAKVYRRMFGILDMEYRFDVVSILMPKHAAVEIELTKGFWNESKFRKQRWNHEAWHEFH